jgi:hypothetical protein
MIRITEPTRIECEDVKRLNPIHVLTSYIKNGPLANNEHDIDSTCFKRSI